VEEEVAMFGSHPFDRYDFLMALSDHIAQFGLEHHESSDNRLGEKMLLTDGGRRGAAGMLAHELAHSWNGKARRPADMVLEDYQQPQATELLWVYEGLTNYLESLIPVRAGLWSEQDWRDQFAYTAAAQTVQSGRRWRSLADTSISAQLQFDSPPAGSDRRRNIDFYEESDLIWLEVDVTIRQITQGRKSLDDFIRQFLGKPARGVRTPAVSPYRYKDLLEALNDAARYDWEEFFRARVYRPAPQAPLGGIEKAGWRLAFQDELPPRLKAFEEASGYSDLRQSVGFILHREGDGKKYKVEDVIVNSPAYQAGIRAGMLVNEVNGVEFTPDRLREAIRAARNPAQQITILLEHDDQFRTVVVNYQGGERYPYLERDAGKRDLLEEIARPLRDR
jgi:predicted metalloprotease with PDZ domain